MMDISKDKTEGDGFSKAWKRLERGKIYIKIDDDVVWMADDTIPRLVTKKVEHPEYFVVSANVVNSPLMGWVHYHMGALHPYLPEYQQATNSSLAEGNESGEAKTRKSWRSSDYPSWEGPDDWSFELDQDPPYAGHRWLRLKGITDIHRTPITQIEYATWGLGLKSWAIAAQEHYSFLENLLADSLGKYSFQKEWITDYERLSINCIAVLADDVLDNLPMDTIDEEWLTKVMPKRLGRSIAVVSEVRSSPARRDLSQLLKICRRLLQCISRLASKMTVAACLLPIFCRGTKTTRKRISVGADTPTTSVT
jgi:hypothetical protein